MTARLGTLMVLIASMIGAGLAQQAVSPPAPPTREQVQKLLEIVGVEQHLDAMLEKRQSKVREGARGCFRDMNPGADDATLKRLDAAFAATPPITSADVSEGLIAELQQRLSAEEVQAGIDFYGSGPGQSLTPVILQHMRVSIGPVVEKKLQAYTSALNRTLMSFQKEMDRQKPPAPHSGAIDATGGGVHSGTI
jgi:hypothetical protein